VLGFLVRGKIQGSDDDDFDDDFDLPEIDSIGGLDDFDDDDEF
jgi:hypothetical protein